MRVEILVLASLKETLLAGPIGQETFIATISGKHTSRRALATSSRRRAEAAGVNK
jgi:hypothetical protein